MEGKSFYKSKMFWVGVCSILAGLFAFTAGELEAGVPLTAEGIVIIVLRFFTREPIKSE
jgi:hypothetical protein